MALNVAAIEKQVFDEIDIALTYLEDTPTNIIQFVPRVTANIAARVAPVALQETASGLKSSGVILEFPNLSGEAGGVVLSAIGGIWAIITVLIALDILLLIGCFHGILRMIFSVMPNWWGARNKVLAFIDIVFRFDQSYAHWVADHFTSSVIEFIHGLAFIIQLFAGSIEFISGKATHIEHRLVPQALINEINGIIARLSRIEHAIADFENVTPSVPTGVATQLHTLHQQVGDLYNRNHVLSQSLSNLYNDHHITAHELHHLESVVSTLSNRIGSVRAIHVSAPDILAQLDAEVERLGKWRPQIEAEVAQQAAHLAVLAPLGMLLTAGLPGLRMLRTLEDEPCQCAEPSIPKPTLSTGDDIWGLYEYFSEG